MSLVPTLWSHAHISYQTRIWKIRISASEGLRDLILGLKLYYHYEGTEAFRDLFFEKNEKN